jgi:hypothetical protein
MVHGVDIRIPSPEDHLRILCFHFLREGAWRPLWLCDIGAFVESRLSTFNWDLFLASDNRRADWFVCVLLLAQRLLDADLTEVPALITGKNPPDWLLKAAYKVWTLRSMQLRHRTPLRTAHQRPMDTLIGLRHHWPSPIEGTVGVNASFNQMSRLPFQIGHCIVRTIRYFREPA